MHTLFKRTTLKFGNRAQNYSKNKKMQHQKNLKIYSTVVARNLQIYPFCQG